MNMIFNKDRLHVDSRYIVLCYKVQWRLTKLAREIEQKAINKYWFISRARHLLWALLCQGILNDQRLNEFGGVLRHHNDDGCGLHGILSAHCHRSLPSSPRRLGQTSRLRRTRSGVRSGFPENESSLREMYGVRVPKISLGAQKTPVIATVGRCRHPFPAPRIHSHHIMN